jgi:hypothetical protein
MRPDELRPLLDELLAPFWNEAGALGFRPLERLIDDRHEPKLTNFLERGQGGPDLAHLVEVDGMVFREPSGATQRALWSARFLTYAQVPGGLRRLTTLGTLIQRTSELRFESLMSFLAGERRPNALERLPGTATLAELWQRHRDRLEGLAVVAPDGDPVAGFDRLRDALLAQYERP